MKKIFPTLGTAVLLTAAGLVQAQTNFIFVTIDDLNRDSLGIHGCPIPDISPHLDALGHAGLRFEHAHVAAANCTPSRNVMVAGMYPHNTKVLAVSNIGTGNHDTFPTLPDVFNAAGYHTGIMGKNSHMLPYQPYAGWDVEYDGYGSTRAPENIYTKLSAAFSNASTLGQPLFFNLNLYDPHIAWYHWNTSAGMPRETTEADPSHIYTRDDVPYPSFFPTLTAAEMEFGTGYNLLDEVAAYYNCVKRADDSIGRMMDAIEDAGASGNTVIILISDHGMELVGGKTQLYHHSSVSPMFVVWPGVTTSNTVDDAHMVNSVDFLPSFCEMIGQPIPAGIDGKSFLPIIHGEEPTDWRDFIYKQHSVAHVMRAVQTTNLLYIFNPWSNGSRTPTSITKSHMSWDVIKAAGLRGTNAEAAVWVEKFEHRTVEELYDTANDPDCKINLFTNSAYAAQLADLQSTMEQEMIDSGDSLILSAFQNRTNAAALEQYIADDLTMRSLMSKQADQTRDVFFDPHDDWEKIDYTIFEPSGEWGIWTPETSGIHLNTSNGDKKSGKSCIEFNGSIANDSRLVVSNALDSSVFEQLKLDVILIDNAAFSAGATLDFQYNDGTGWNTFQTISSAGKKNLTFELPGGGLPDTMLFGIRANLNSSGGSIYMDHARLTAWQEWTNVPTNAPFDATDLGHIRLTFDFEAQNFVDADNLLLEYYTGSAWETLKDYAFDYVLQTHKTYTDTVELYPSTHPFSSNMEFRFRSESTDAGQAFTIDNYTIETRLASESVTITVPPTANPDSYSETDPRAIVVSAPGILDNDTPGSGSNLTATLMTDVVHGILEFNPDGSFVYAATNGYIGTDAFTYMAYDGNAFSSTATVSLAINEALLNPVIFFDDFESGDLVTGDWENSGNSATLYMSSSAYNGAYGVRIRNGGFISKTTTTENYSDIQVSYWCKWVDGSPEDPDPAELLAVEWSSNGIDWVEIETTQSNDWHFTTASLPPEASNQSTFMLRFDVASDNWNEAGYVDDVTIQGTPMSSGGAITNFSDWAALHGVATNSEYTLDYALNINPHLAERYTLSEGGESGLPFWEFPQVGERLVVDYVRRTQAIDLIYTVQFTDNLTSNWMDAVSSETITPIDDEFERVSVQDHMTETETTNRFGRVIVIQ